MKERIYCKGCGQELHSGIKHVCEAFKQPDISEYTFNGKMGKKGVLAGKFTPPTKGHLNYIIEASTMVEELIVIVSENRNLTKKLCEENNLPYMSGETRAKWLTSELSGFKHIKVKLLDETHIPTYPDGWKPWSNMVKELVGDFDVIFGNEYEYAAQNAIYFPNARYIITDLNRNEFNISATKLRSNPLKYWDFTLGSTRSTLCKKVLIAGSESCGKSTITKYLAKIFNTSWSEEYGRTYTESVLFGNDELFTKEDFEIIAKRQHDIDLETMKNSNKICFFDSDALITKFYLDRYLGQTSNVVDSYIDPKKYDLVLLFTPSVKWVDDGLRLDPDSSERWRNHNKIARMYKDYGFTNILEISEDTYYNRLKAAKNIIKEMWGI